MSTHKPTQPEYVRCEPCQGTGMKGRYRHGRRNRYCGPLWVIEPCRKCGGRGSFVNPKRN